MVERTAGGFGKLLRRLRTEAGLTQEELAETATLSPRSVSDLERGVNATARKETARLLADALGLVGPQRVQFEATARGRDLASAGEDLAGTPGPLGGSRRRRRGCCRVTSLGSPAGPLSWHG